MPTSASRPIPGRLEDPRSMKSSPPGRPTTGRWRPARLKPCLVAIHVGRTDPAADRHLPLLQEVSDMPTPPAFEIEQVAIDRLRPDPANPRRIGQEELEALTRSLREWGFVQPVLARREDSTVFGGHQRLVAARRLGLTTVPVIWLDIDLEQARLLNLALNRISGSWDEQLLAHLLADLKDVPDLDLSLSGFGEDELKDLLRSLDARERAERVEDFDFE